MTIRYDYGDVETGDITLHTTEWRGQVIARRHAFNPIIEQILNRHFNTELLSIGIQGKSSTGKTTLATDIMHSIHTELNKLSRSTTLTERQKEVLERKHHYQILTKKELIEFGQTIESMPRTNRVLYFDDLSFLESIFGRKGIGQVKNLVTEVRHLDETLDVNTILIFGYHYSYGLDKFLRDTDYRFYLSVSDEEEGNIISQIHATQPQKQLIKSFKKTNTKFKEKNQITIQLSKTRQKKYGSVTYRYSDPFRLSLFYNGESLKTVVFPKSEWLLDDCQICNNLKKNGKKQGTKISNGKLRNWLTKRYGNDQLESAVRSYATANFGLYHTKREIMNLFRIFDILVSNGSTTKENLVSTVLGDNYLKMIQNRTKIKKGIRIPQQTRDDFMLITGYDGLHSPNSKPRSKKEIKTVKSEDMA